jgi:hypothetical protein
MSSHMPAKVLAVFGLLTIATAARAAVDCPRSSQEHRLTTFSLFEGDPAKQVELAPGSVPGPNGRYVNTWPLRSSVGLVAVCHFEGAPSSVSNYPLAFRAAASRVGLANCKLAAINQRQ